MSSDFFSASARSTVVDVVSCELARSELVDQAASAAIDEVGFTGAEGYRIRIQKGGAAPAIFVIGNDARGVLFGAVFVPGGDPGHTQPKYMFDLLEKQTQNLHRFHPKARMWMSPQGFNKEWMDEFYGLMKQEPGWLSGIVFGPQIRASYKELRERVPRKYPIRIPISGSPPWWDSPAAAADSKCRGVSPGKTMSNRCLRPRSRCATQTWIQPLSTSCEWCTQAKACAPFD